MATCSKASPAPCCAASPTWHMWSGRDLAVHCVCVAARGHGRKDLLSYAVPSKTVQHCIASLRDALQQRLHRRQTSDRAAASVRFTFARVRSLAGVPLPHLQNLINQKRAIHKHLRHPVSSRDAIVDNAYLAVLHLLLSTLIPDSTHGECRANGICRVLPDVADVRHDETCAGLTANLRPARPPPPPPPPGGPRPPGFHAQHGSGNVAMPVVPQHADNHRSRRSGSGSAAGQSRCEAHLTAAASKTRDSPDICITSGDRAPATAPSCAGSRRRQSCGLAHG